MGVWDKGKVIVYRWNGTKGAEGGNPQSRGFPTWIILDHELYPFIVSMLPPDKQFLAKAYLNIQ